MFSKTSLSKCLAINRYRERVGDGLAIQNNRRRVSIDELESGVKNGRFVYAEFVESGSEFSFCIAQQSDWETNILGKLCLKVVYFFSTSYETANYLLDDFIRSIPKHAYLISFDSNLSPTFQDLAFQEKGFHIGLHYYDWEGNTTEIDRKFSTFHKRFNYFVPEQKDLKEFRLFADSFSRTGRFSEDPYLKVCAGKIYAEWVTGAFADEGKMVVGYRKENNLQGFITFDIPVDGLARLGILRTNDSHDAGLVGYSLISYACHHIINNGGKKIEFGTSKSNHAINSIYLNNGFRITNSGIQFHWVNTTMVPF